MSVKGRSKYEEDPAKPGTKPRKRNPRKTPVAAKRVKRYANGAGVLQVAKTTGDLLDNPESVKDWDDEELRRGYRRDRNGNFTGRPPAVIPTFVHRELVRRQFAEAEKHLRDNVAEAAEVLTQIIKNPKNEAKDRLKAIEILFNRLLGSAPQRVELSLDKPKWQEVAEAAVVAIVPTDDDEIVDAEIVEETG